MDELARQLQDARDHVQPAWDEARSQRLYAGIEQLRRRRLAMRATGGMALAAAATLAFFVASGDPKQSRAVADVELPSVAPSAAIAPQPASMDEGVTKLDDGSLASLVGEGGELKVLADSPERTEIDLLSGHGHFEVVKNPAREFVVHAGQYRVVVLGTVFDVTRLEQGIEVSVMQGTVRVEGGAEAMVMVAGSSQRFEPAAQAPDEDPAAASPDRPKRPRNAGWRSLVKDDDYKAAYAALKGGASVENSAAALMDAADAARLSGHPKAATGYLDRVVNGHKRSPMAPLAAFTLGRVYLDQLGEPNRAASAFERARLLAPRGQMAQDALAREVEALSKAGDARKAYLRAQQYVEAYPNGRRIRAVRLHGGM